MIAILPAAGKGTRMGHLSGGRPKELLPIGGRPVIQWVLEEAFAAGVSKTIVVASRDKPMLVSYLRDRTELAYQESPAGHGAAVAVPDVKEPVLVLNPDTIFFPSSPAGKLKALIESGWDIALALEEVPDEKVSQYGIVELGGSGVQRILEKPSPGETASRFAIAGRFGLSAKAFAYLRSKVACFEGAGEISLTRILGLGVAEGYLNAIAVAIERDEQRLDCGDPEGYARASKIIAQL